MSRPRTRQQRTDQTTNWKIPPQRIPSDDCTVYIGRVIEDGEITEEGTPYKVHEGEYVELFPVQSLSELIALSDIMAVTRDPEAFGAMRQLCRSLSERVVSWDWTGNDGQPLAQPHNNPEVLESLTNDELMWLFSAVKGKETEADRKNA